MGKYYFAAKIQQEYADLIVNRAIELGVPKENIMMKAAGCEFLFSGIYIKFDNPEIYKKFCSAQIPGVIELW